MKMAMLVAASMPLITVVPMLWREIAPEPDAIQSGTQPKMNAKLVIKIGRSRWAAPLIAASTIDSPPRSSSIFANSTIRIAFFATRPISMMRPTCEKTSLSRPRSQMPRNAPNTAIGVVCSTLHGSDQHR
jgi:hypothetical protein